MNTSIPLKDAPQLFEFFKTQFLHEGSDRKNRSRRFWKSEWSLVHRSAQNPNWFKELNEKKKMSRWAFILQTALRDSPDLVRHLESNFDDQNFSISSSASVNLKYVQGFRDGITKSLSLDHQCISFLDSLMAQGDRELDEVEVCYWMLFSYYEIALRLSAFNVEPGDIDDPSKLMFPPDFWVPTLKGKGLISTRFQVVDNLLKNFTNKLDDSQTKRLKRARTGNNIDKKQIITKETQLPNAINPDGIYSAISDFLYMNKRPSENIQNDIKEYICMMLRFASYFEYIQVKLLNSDVEPKDIVTSFKRYPLIRADFEKNLSLV